MTIQASTMLQFLDIVDGLVERGIGFRADAATLIIILTGAF